MSYFERRRHEAKDLDGFLAWARSAQRGDYCIYHRGDLGYDRASCMDTRQLAATVRILAEHDFVILSQGRTFDFQRDYIATRTGHGTPPKAVLAQQITAIQFEALRGVLEYTRDNLERRSAMRAVRDAISAANQNVAAAVFDDLVKHGWIESKGPGCGYDLTALGLRMLV
jgi:hypothetical protein